MFILFSAIFTLSPDGLIETTDSQLDRETQDYYEMIVRARDGGGRYSNGKGYSFLICINFHI